MQMRHNYFVEITQRKTYGFCILYALPNRCGNHVESSWKSHADSTFSTCLIPVAPVVIHWNCTNCLPDRLYAFWGLWPHFLTAIKPVLSKFRVLLVNFDDLDVEQAACLRTPGQLTQSGASHCNLCSVSDVGEEYPDVCQCVRGTRLACSGKGLTAIPAGIPHNVTGL